MRAEKLLSDLTGPQQDAVTTVAGPLLVLAGPGSGKTRVITRRAAYLALTTTQPWHVLAITFTNRAANEMAERIRQLEAGAGIHCSTFHSFCARLLRIHGERAGLKPNFSIFDESDQLAAMKKALVRAELSAENFTPGAVLDKVSRAKNDMLLPADVEKRDGGGFINKGIARAYVAYDQVLAEQNAVDFDDLLLKVARLLQDHPDLRDQLEDRYRYVLVDEYQDTNTAQYLIARLLAARGQNLCVTGDPDQSIYAWRGANVQNILQFEEDFPTAKVVRLEQNYRSTPQILSSADALIAHNRRRKQKRLWTVNPPGGGITVAECQDNRAEALYIAGKTREHIAAGGVYSDVAVFYRVNALSRVLEAALFEAHIPYQVARGVAFYNRKEIKDVIAYLKLVANPLDQVALERIINMPARGIGKTTVERLLAHAAATGGSPLELMARGDIPNAGRAARALTGFAELMRAVSSQVENGVQETIEYLVRYSGLEAMWTQANNNDARDNVEELVNAAAEYDRQHADGSGSLVDYLTQVSLVSDQDMVDDARGAVTLMTLHAAKGLEFNVVFIAGLEDGLLPHQRSQVESTDVEEERRLCFVGITRAKRSLTLTLAKWRDFRGMTHRTARSQFLSELPREDTHWVHIGEDGCDLACRDESDTTDYTGVEMHSARPWLNWRRGQLVHHADYGIGRILWIEPQYRQTRAGVQFAAYGAKTFILEHARLEAVDPHEIGDP